jgi:hypothetical protein
MTRDTEYMDAMQKAALDKITTHYPHRVAGALDELIREQHRLEEDSAWARDQMMAQQKEISALKRALATRGVRAVRALERRVKR